MQTQDKICVFVKLVISTELSTFFNRAKISRMEFCELCSTSNYKMHMITTSIALIFLQVIAAQLMHFKTTEPFLSSKFSEFI